MVLLDHYGRPLLNLRIALTKPCNLHCSYCHGEGEYKNAVKAEMTAQEIIRIAKIAVKLGVSRIKLTGGEPLMRKDILQIVRGIAEIPGLEELSMTTNGTLLAPIAKDLRANGLKRVNISLPTINRDTYCKLTGGRLEDALKGVEAAVEAELNPVKLNMLVLQGVNDSQVNDMIDFARQTGAILQLIELEPINISMEYYKAHHKPLEDYEEMLRQRALYVESRRYMQNRRVYRLPGVSVEVVHPIENTEFCRYCTRMRVTSDGKLKPCLMRNDNLVDILAPMRNGASERELMEIFKLANEMRQPYNLEEGL
ncbi:MAG: GTP 3',8-cyclase MoaA [Nitrososphaerota archaeon]|nr:GTP 3',8-cyclase MoaA [Candidatus Bathyarchaeota archaeon]MDW8193516.1 GTP 3',8-cyclase MoaA [Nitrososphaerota archaeon]